MRLMTALALMVVPLMGFVSCTVRREPAPETPLPARDIHLERYRAFVVDNMALLDALYTDTYDPCEFVVDTETGSAPVQTLIPESAVQSVVDALVDPRMSRQEIIDAVVAFVRDDFDFIAEPHSWRHVRETLRRRSGDCKNLSLLIIAMLNTAGVETFGAVSNGHMWVAARSDDRWQVIETDPDPQRRTIYRVPGFYRLPLYRLYPDRCEKRRRRVRGDGDSPGGDRSGRFTP